MPRSIVSIFVLATVWILLSMSFSPLGFIDIPTFSVCASVFLVAVIFGVWARKKKSIHLFVFLFGVFYFLVNCFSIFQSTDLQEFSMLPGSLSVALLPIFYCGIFSIGSYKVWNTKGSFNREALKENEGH